MNNVPYFRVCVRAIGEHLNPKETAYCYRMVEFYPNGTFKRLPAVPLNQTKTRREAMRVFEEQFAGLWVPVDVARFRECLKLWNQCKLMQTL